MAWRGAIIAQGADAISAINSRAIEFPRRWLCDSSFLVAYTARAALSMKNPEIDDIHLISSFDFPPH
jgi:hypothetical protein